MGGHRPIILGAALGLLAFLAGFGFGADPVEDWQLAARYTARVAFLLFLFVYAMGPAFQLTRAEYLNGVVRNRRAWGLGFAMAHGVHFVALIVFVAISSRPTSSVTLLFGGLGYAVLLALVLTSNDAAVKRLGAHWKTLHRLGVHYLWLIFTLTYLGRMAEPEPSMQSYMLFAFALAAAALRLAAFAKVRVRPKAP